MNYGFIDPLLIVLWIIGLTDEEHAQRVNVCSSSRQFVDFLCCEGELAYASRAETNKMN